MVSAWSKTRADPNGYYEVLGLSKNKPWTMAEIQKAYRRKARAYHPDGSAPDPKMFTRIQVAYEVLSAPELRAEYDSLDTQKRWVDDRVISLLREKLSQGVIKIDLSEIVKEKLNPEKTVWEQRREYDTPCYYYDTEAEPERESALTWIDQVCDIAVHMGFSGKPLRVGFTDTESHIISRSWGRILMICSDLPGELVKQYFEEPDESTQELVK